MNFSERFELPLWPRNHGTPLVRGILRAELEDFRVDELPQVQPSGEGGHLWLEVEKRGANTDWVAMQLASAAECHVRDVGFAGMKDRHAVTSQWYSLPLPGAGADAWRSWQIADVHIRQALPHQRKLKRGALKGNRFRIVLRDLRGDLDNLESRLKQVNSLGIPNYFGPQRFGHGGRNVPSAVRWLKQGGRLPRTKRSLYLSAVRSFLFNQVLALRVEQGTWNQLLDGDIAVLEGSHSVFACTLPDEVLSQRCQEFDLHPTGPLPGRGGMAAERTAGDIEQSVLEAFAEVVDALQNAGVDASRRALRLPVRDLLWEFTGDCLQLDFSLPPGAYATTVIDELVSTTDGHHV